MMSAAVNIKILIKAHRCFSAVWVSFWLCFHVESNANCGEIVFSL